MINIYCFEFQLLELQEKEGHWETRYFLLLWLSILVLIPFHLSRFDSGAASGGDLGSTPSTLMSRILNVIKFNLLIGDKCQDASAFLSGNLYYKYRYLSIYLSRIYVCANTFYFSSSLKN